jgi:hypothetical protein
VTELLATVAGPSMDAVHAAIVGLDDRGIYDGLDVVPDLAISPDMEASVRALHADFLRPGWDAGPRDGPGFIGFLGMYAVRVDPALPAGTLSLVRGGPWSSRFHRGPDPPDTYRGGPLMAAGTNATDDTAASRFQYPQRPKPGKKAGGKPVARATKVKKPGKGKKGA